MKSAMKPSLLTRSGWRFFTRHRWQLWLTLLSIALGTAVMIAVDLANQSAGTSFSRSVTQLSGAMTHEITARKGMIPDAFYRQLRIDWGYRDSLPQVEVKLRKDGLQYTLLGFDPFATPLQQEMGVEIAAGDLTRLMTRTDSVVVSAKLAERFGVDAGDQLLFEHGGHSVVLTVLAVVPNRSGSEMLFSDIATAQTLINSAAKQDNKSDGGTSGLSRIQLQLTPEQAASLDARLPVTLKLESYQSRQEVFSQMTQAFSTNLLAMSLLAMLVGAFLVYNTMTFSVLQRRQSFAVGRMVGVTGGQLFRHLLLEALVLGLLGSLSGVLLGILLGQGLLILVSQTINDLFIKVSAGDLLIQPASIIKGVGITLLAVLVATLAPAREAAAVSPVLVQRRSYLEQGGQRGGLRLALAGVLLIGLSGVLISLSGRSLSGGFIGLFLLILGYSLCVPLILRGVLSLLQTFTATRATLLWRMAIRGVQSGLSRTSLAIIALTVAVSATVGVSMMVGSFRSSVADWLEMTLSSDLYISANPDEDASALQGVLHPDWMARLRELPEVASVSSGRTATPEVDGVAVSALVLEPGPHSSAGFDYLAGDAEQIWPQYEAGRGILVSEPFAYHRNKQAGDSVRIMTDTAGEVTLPILGVFRDYSSTQGMLSIPRALYERYWNDHSRSSIGIKLHDGAQTEAVMRKLESWVPTLTVAEQSLLIRSNQAIRQFSLDIFDRTFAVTNVLRVLVIIVAFVGVFSALMALFLERGREFGILRATGFTPQQLRQLILSQTALIGVLAGLLSLPLGWMLSEVLIGIINRRSFGWTMQTYFFAWVPVQAVLLALFAALLAGVYPVRRIGQMSVRKSLFD
jgi:putative ABC transport system permease protein